MSPTLLSVGDGAGTLSDEFWPPKGSSHRMDTLAVHVWAPLRRDDLPGLFSRVCALLCEHDPDVVLCDVGDCEPDLVALAALTRLQLAARRRGCQVRLARATGEMLALVAFLGLARTLPADGVAQRDEPARESALVEQVQVQAQVRRQPRSPPAHDGWRDEQP